MSQKLETSKADTGKDRLVWSLIIALLAGSAVANYYYSDFPWALRATAWILMACLLVVLALLTAKGQEIRSFSKDARIELRKVVWPTRQETIQSTLVVIVMVIITALLLWAIDSVLLLIVARFTG